MHLSNHSVKNDNIEYFIQLVQIAMADNIISEQELELLHRIGHRIGLTDREIKDLIEKTDKSNHIPPYAFSERFEQVYTVVKMILVDGIIDKDEMRLANNFASNSGFKDSEIPKLLVILISGIKQGKSEEALFEEYKKDMKLRYESEIKIGKKS